MTSKRINPTALYESTRFGFSHAALDEATGTLHLAGQVAWDKDYNVVGGDDLAAQAAQALANIKTVLAEMGAGVEHLLRLRTFIVNYDLSKLEAVGGALAAFYGDVLPAPNTIVGVQALALPDFLIEIEAVATLPKAG
jgi:enamine deaminase RidA (YjgF/YER057c/UK114 family)